MLVIYHSVLSLPPLCCLRNSRPSSCPLFGATRAANGENSERESRNNVFRRRRIGKSERRGANGIDKLDFSRTTIKFIKSTLKGRGEEEKEQDGDSTGNNSAEAVLCLSECLALPTHELGSINPRHSIIAHNEIISLGSSSI